MGLDAVRVHSCLQRFAWYCDSDVTPLYAAAVSEFDDAKALVLRRQISMRYHDQAPIYAQIRQAGHEGGDFFFVPSGRTM